MLYRLSLGLILAGAAFAQIGYPGGGYPYPGGSPYPGRSPYPGAGGGSPLPIPGRRGQQKPKADAQPLPAFQGTLKRLDEKTISLELGDNRVLDFRRTGKTRFFKGADEVKSPKWAAGDAVSVEATEEPGGYMTAVNVHWERAAGSTDTASTGRSPERDKAEGTPDTWAKDDDPDRPRLRRTNPAPKADEKASDKPAEESVPQTAKVEATAEKAPVPAQRDEDDPGRPILRRGGAANKREAAPERPAETAAVKPPAAPVMRDGNDNTSIPVVRRGDGDDVIRKATDAALEFTETLPAYVCQEMITRYQSEGGKPARWEALDVVTMNLVYENGREDYRDIKVNGKPKGSLEETGGAWSTGEFGTVLIDLFSPLTATDFVFARDSRSSGIPTKVYDFRVARENSHWSIKMGSQSYDPPYKGSVWIDPKSGRVLRIEMQGHSFPTSFPVDHVESAVDYQYIRLGDARQYLLPVHAETLTCQRGTSFCSKNTIDFRNYRKYSGEATIKFEDAKEAPKDKK